MTEENQQHTGVQVSNDDLLSVLLQVKKNIMKSILVASIGKVKSVDTTNQTAVVQVYPLLEDEAEKNLECRYLASLSDLTTNDIALIVFCDRNFITALKKLKQNQKPSSLKENVDLHSDRYGIIIGKL